MSITFGIVAYDFVGQPFSKKLYVVNDADLATCVIMCVFNFIRLLVVITGAQGFLR